MKRPKRTLLYGGLAGLILLLLPASLVLWMSFHPEQRPREPRLGAVAMTPDLTRVYISDFTRGEILVYSLASGKQVSAIRTRDGPGQVVFSPDSARAYAMTFRGDTNRAVEVIDTAASAVIAVIPANDYPFDNIAISADGKRLTLASTSAGSHASTLQIDTGTYTALDEGRSLDAKFHNPGSLARHGALYAIAGCATCDPPEGRGWGKPGPPRRDFFVKLLRTDTPGPPPSIALGAFQAHRIGVSPDGGMLAMMAPPDGEPTTSVRLADTKTGRIVARVNIESAYLLDMQFSRDGRYLYVLNDVRPNAEPTLIRIDVQTQAVAMTRLRGRPREITDASNDGLVFMLAMAWDRSSSPARTRALIHIVDSGRATPVKDVAIQGSVAFMLQELAWNAADGIRQRAPWYDGPPGIQHSEAITLE